MCLAAHSLSFVFPMFIHIAAWVRTVSSLWLNNSPLYADHILCVYSPLMDVWLSPPFDYCEPCCCEHLCFCTDLFTVLLGVMGS